MDALAILAAVSIAADWRAALQSEWSGLMNLSVWGQVKSSRLGAMNRVRRRVLEVGEKLNSLCAAREWIPHPREQLKNALGSSFSLKESLEQLNKAVNDVDTGVDAPLFKLQLGRLQAVLGERLPDLENQWAGWLDSQYLDEEEEN